MEKIIILKVSEKKRAFKHSIVNEINENMPVIEIKARRSAIKKLLKQIGQENVVINHLQVEHNLFSERTKIFNHILPETALPIIENVCRQVALKYSMRIPFEEVYISASPADAFSLIIPLLGITRLFTVISNEALGKMADELYFKHGCIIRQIPKLKEVSGGDRIFIRADEKSVLNFPSIPIIDLTNSPSSTGEVIKINEISVCDSNIAPFCEAWGGKSGLMLYNLLGYLPERNAETDISKKADKIFLLDRDKF